MKQKLLLTTALVAATFVITGAKAGETEKMGPIANEDELNITTDNDLEIINPSSIDEDGNNKCSLAAVSTTATYRNTDKYAITNVSAKNIIITSDSLGVNSLESGETNITATKNIRIDTKSRGVVSEEINGNGTNYTTPSKFAKTNLIAGGDINITSEADVGLSSKGYNEDSKTEVSLSTGKSVNITSATGYSVFADTQGKTSITTTSGAVNITSTKGLGIAAFDQARITINAGSDVTVTGNTNTLHSGGKSNISIKGNGNVNVTATIKDNQNEYGTSYSAICAHESSTILIEAAGDVTAKSDNADITTNEQVDVITSDGTSQTLIKAGGNVNVETAGISGISSYGAETTIESGGAVSVNTQGMSVYAEEGGTVKINANEDITATSTLQSDEDYSIVAHSQNSTVNVASTNGNITVSSEYGSGIGAVEYGKTTVSAQNGTVKVTAANNSIDSQVSGETEIKAENIDVTATNDDGTAVHAAYDSSVALNGNTVLTAATVLSATDDSKIYLNKDQTNTTVLNGNIIADKSSEIVAVLTGESSVWNGQTVTSSSAEKITQADITLQNGAVWNASALSDNTTFLNTLTVNNGTINITDVAKAKTVNIATGTINGGTLNVGDNMTVTDTLSLNGTNLAGDGTITFAQGSVLNVKVNQTTIANEVKNEGATLNLIFDTGFEGYYEMVTGTLDNEFSGYNNNALYDISASEDKKGTYFVTKNSADQVAKNLGLNSNEKNALTAALSSGNSTNEDFVRVADNLNTAAQLGDSATAKEASKLGTVVAPVLHTVESKFHNALFNTVTNQLDNAPGAIAQGQSSGDVFKKVSTWIRGFVTNANKDKTNKAEGFDADTYGVALGIEKQFDNRIKVGLGYAYGNTDIKDDSRKIDVDSNTLFVYGKYQPNQWYVNSMLAYSWSDYEEKKSITGIDAGAKYDVDTISVQSILGYETQYAGYDITPEVGFRYIHSELDNYRDKLGTQVASRDADVFTLVLGPKIAKDYTFENGYIIRPELRAAITYDLFTDNNNYLVTLANGAAYQVDGEKMARFGYELGAKITAFSNNNWDILAGYTARLRDEYNDNTYMLEAKYHF